MAIIDHKQKPQANKQFDPADRFGDSKKKTIEKTANPYDKKLERIKAFKGSTPQEKAEWVFQNSQDVFRDTALDINKNERGNYLIGYDEDDMDEVTPEHLAEIFDKYKKELEEDDYAKPLPNLKPTLTDEGQIAASKLRYKK